MASLGNLDQAQFQALMAQQYGQPFADQYWQYGDYDPESGNISMNPQYYGMLNSQLATQKGIQNISFDPTLQQAHVMPNGSYFDPNERSDMMLGSDGLYYYSYDPNHPINQQADFSPYTKFDPSTGKFWMTHDAFQNYSNLADQYSNSQDDFLDKYGFALTSLAFGGVAGAHAAATGGFGSGAGAGSAFGEGATTYPLAGEVPFSGTSLGTSTGTLASSALGGGSGVGGFDGFASGLAEEAGLSNAAFEASQVAAGGGDLASVMGAANPSSSGFWSNLLSTGKVAGIDLTKAGTALANLFAGKANANDLQKIAEAAAARSDPAAAERPFYQQQLKQSFTDPNYFANNPVLKGINNLAMDETQRRMSARGYNMSGNEMQALSTRLQDESMKYAQPMQSMLGQYGGLTANPSYAGLNYGNIASQAANQNYNSLGNLGVLAGELSKGLPQLANAFGGNSNNTPNTTGWLS